MRVTVDLTMCKSYGQCVFAAPEVFSLDEEDTLRYVANPDDSLIDEVEHAALVCPARAITVSPDGEAGSAE